MRAMLIVNPIATTITPAARDLVAHALESRVDLTVAPTTHAGHAEELGRQAVAEGFDLVVVYGGDGTVSAVVNGMLGKPGSTPAGPVPALGIIPGGSANVMARSLGIPRDAAEAGNQLIDLLDEYDQHHQWRRISLIDCGEIYAMVNAGMGVDAEVVRAVEEHRSKGHKMTPVRYWRVAIPVSVRFTRKPANIVMELPGREPVSGVHFVWVSNTSPWTYSDERPMVTNPGCSFETGLGVFAFTEMKLIPTIRVLLQLMVKRPDPKADHLIRDDDVSYVRVTKMTTPAACQYDGEYLGLRDSMTLRVVPNALAVVAPPPNPTPNSGS